MDRRASAARFTGYLWTLIGVIAIALFFVVGQGRGRAADTGSISGEVTVLGDTVAGVRVVAELQAEDPYEAETTTAGNGNYQINGLPPGDYIVQFIDDSGEGYIDEWYDDAHTREEATHVPVVANVVATGVNANLTKGGAISGRVGDEFNGLPGQVVELYSLDGDKLSHEATTDETGHYVIDFLKPGTYKALDTDEGIWYSNKSSFGTANAIIVTDEKTTKNIDFFVDTTGSISGTVIGEYYGPVGDVAVGLFSQNEELLDWEVSDADGSFSFDHLAAANYFLFATDPLGDFADAWHPDATHFDVAFGVTVELRQDVTGKDILMQALQPAGLTDINGSTFEADIVWLALNGITKGCNPPDNDRYCPDGTVTRGQMAAFIKRFLGLPAASNDHFGDDDGTTFEDDINRLAEAGITRGCNPPTNDRFCPDDFVTRGEMAAFMVRALHLTARLDDPFLDDDGSTFEADIEKLAAAGVTRGCNPPDNDRFCPDDPVSRGQMAAFLHRAAALLTS